MSTTTLPRPVTVEPDAGPDQRVTILGDFNCPWSYLAFRRARVLAAAGIPVDWHAVEHAPRRPGAHDDAASRFAGLHEEMEEVLARLLPEEELPYDLAGFLPRTAAAVAAYAEGYAAHVAAPVARVLFESFWMHGIDVGDVNVLRTLLIDELRSGCSPSATVREWGVPVAVTGAPISTAAWRLIRDWAGQWREIGEHVVPVLQLPGGEPIRGVAAVDWLGDRITELGLGVEPPVDPPPSSERRELPSITWVTGNGGRWLRRYQRFAGQN